MTSNDNKTPPPPPPISLSSVSSEEAVPTTTPSNNWKVRLEEIDHTLSKFIFQWQVPAMVEYVWSIPGNFFGIPLAALFIIPSWSVVALEVLLLADNNERQQQQGYDYYSYYWTHWWMVGLYVWTLLLLFAWNQLLNGDKKYIKVIYGPKTGAIAPLMGVAWIYLYPTSSIMMDDQQLHNSSLASHHHKLVGSYLIAAWSLAVLPIAYVKPWGNRRRPAAHPSWRVAYGRRKHLPMLPEILAQDAYASFPSGDVAGAVAWAHGMRLAVQNSDNDNARVAIACWSVVVVTALGRSYWLAHHVADTMAGALLPHGPLMVLDWMVTRYTGLDPGHATAEMALTSFFCLAVQVVAIRKYHKRQMFGAGTMHE